MIDFSTEAIFRRFRKSRSIVAVYLSRLGIGEWETVGAVVGVAVPSGFSRFLNGIDLEFI